MGEVEKETQSAWGRRRETLSYFRGYCVYIQPSVELGLEDVSLLERCPHFRGFRCRINLCLSASI